MSGEAAGAGAPLGVASASVSADAVPDREVLEGVAGTLTFGGITFMRRVETLQMALLNEIGHRQGRRDAETDVLKDLRGLMLWR